MYKFTIYLTWTVFSSVHCINLKLMITPECHQFGHFWKLWFNADTHNAKWKPDRAF